MKPHLLLIDNYDSFTYNLVQAFLVLGAEVSVYRNDALRTQALLGMQQRRKPDLGIDHSVFNELPEDILRNQTE